MADTLKILGIAGSIRKASYNRLALRAAQSLCPDGAAIDIFEIGDIPPFNQDDENSPPVKITQLKSKIRSAAAVLLVTPEYNYSIPGLLKNAIDWASRPYGDSAWRGKPVAIMGASVGVFGTVHAKYHLRQVFAFLDMDPVNQPEVMIGNADNSFDANGNLLDDKTRDLIKQLLANLVAKARAAAR
jgi:chromate reductase